jgi:hypothetical protein
MISAISISGVAGGGTNWGLGGSRTLKPDLNLLDFMVIIPLITRTFIGLSCRSRMNPGPSNKSEKSDACKAGKYRRLADESRKPSVLETYPCSPRHNYLYVYGELTWLTLSVLA